MIKKLALFFIISQVVLLNAIKLGWGHEVPLDLIKEVLPNNPVILEAGAHYAQDTRWMAQRWPQGVIHAFEPTPVNFKRLKKAAQEHTNIKCYSYALDIECGIKLFYQDDMEDRGNQGANSLLPHKILKTSSNKPIQVECITIDAWAHQEGIDHIDFMWLDVEGNELNALKGALNILPTVKVIFAEVNLKELWHECVLYDTLKNWLTQNGFEEVWQDLHGRNGNVLFIKK